MNGFLIVAIALNWIVVGVGVCLGWQLLRQNGRMLLRLDELEKRLDELEFGGADGEPSVSALAGLAGDSRHSLASRFSDSSLARSRIKRDGLKAGTRAPEFRLPRLDGRGELALEGLRG